MFSKVNFMNGGADLAEGIAVADLKDAYPTVMEDLQKETTTRDRDPITFFPKSKFTSLALSDQIPPISLSHHHAVFTHSQLPIVTSSSSPNP
ncbi:hypothetical protein L6452_41399 [Arctium lappa]|uniref:Uncharacterized protein n=1 Tax=Arctium lappa TaxID=4217 RepID=A0ACB8XT34_ARCLA|nr:hypothetical protein L6452_41399 [Arctium lappa]